LSVRDNIGAQATLRPARACPKPRKPWLDLKPPLMEAVDLAAAFDVFPTW